MAETTTNTNPGTAETELEATRAKLAATEQELNNYKLRLADFENARKRLLRDAETDRKYAAESLARDLLGALDNLDRALSAAKAAGDAGPLATGVSATATQFLDILKRYGVTRIECGPGTVFDPNLHQAVMEQPSGGVQPGEVVQVLEQGFKFHDRVLRPASVIVAAKG
jgi:molecular chaperone GrpE